MPGLVDAHCHMHCSATADAQDLTLAEMHDVGRLKMRAVTNMRKALLAGTTTVRDIGSRNEVAFDIQRAINEGAIPGPRLLVAGTPITITAGHCWFFGTEADTADEVAKAVRTQVETRRGRDKGNGNWRDVHAHCESSQDTVPCNDAASCCGGSGAIGNHSGSTHALGRRRAELRRG